MSIYFIQVDLTKKLFMIHEFCNLFENASIFYESFSYIPQNITYLEILLQISILDICFPNHIGDCDI